MKRIIEKIKRYLKNDLEKEERDFLTEYHCAEYRGVPEKREQILFVENQPFYTYELEGKLTEEKQFIIKSECAGDNISITFRGKNLYSGKSVSGYLKYNDPKRYGVRKDCYKTTEWFAVDDSQRYLYMAGDAFNRAVWQFCDGEGGLIPSKVPAGIGKYRIVNQKKFDNSVAKTAIPKGAKKARVYFACSDDSDCAELGTVLQIGYGLIPEFCVGYYQETAGVPGIKGQITLKIGKQNWELYGNREQLLKTGNCELDMEAVSSLEIKGLASGKVSLAAEPFTGESPDHDTEVRATGVGMASEEDKEYGVRWKMDSPIPVCERVGDAKGLHFNYKMADCWAANYNNDFDGIFPWSQIKTCTVAFEEDGKRRIIYEGEDGFARDGSSGEVMVEIPAYYTKREQKDGYEYLWITKKQKDGYCLDPSFVTKDGVKEHIYISAYQASEADGMLHSRSNTFVTLRRSMVEWRKMTDTVHGFSGYDLLAHFTVQRLYLIETAVLDSQAIFEGICYLPYKVKNTKTAYYALEDGKDSDTIIVRETPVTRRILEGDSATVLERWNEYRNEPYYQRVILKSEPLEGKRLKITFSGEKRDIFKEKTAISALPRKNGNTDALDYHTARGDTNQQITTGHESFRYRGMENLWGNAWMTLEHCYVRNNRLHVTYPDQTERICRYDLPVQDVILTSKQFGDPTNMCIKKMGYDKENPLLMFPCEIGNGASTNTYYCDAWYNLAQKDVKYLVTYGGAWDNLGYAGIFCYRANYKETEKIPFNSIRLILR